MTNRLLVKHNGEFVDVGVDNGITEFDYDKTYRVNDQVWYVFNNELRYYLSVTDNNRGNTPYYDDGTNWLVSAYDPKLISIAAGSTEITPDQYFSIDYQHPQRTSVIWSSGKLYRYVGIKVPNLYYSSVDEDNIYLLIINMTEQEQRDPERYWYNIEFREIPMGGGGGGYPPDNKTLDTYNEKLQIKNEGVTKSKINSEAGVVFEEDIQTLKNKVISAADNTLSNLETKHLKTGVLDTSSLTNDDVHIPSSKLVKTYADTKIAIPSTRANRVMAWDSSGNPTTMQIEKHYEHFMTIKRNATTDDTTYISFSVVNNESSITLAKLCSYLYSNGFTSKSTAYPAGGLAAANTIYVASSSGGSPTTSFSATSCINGVYSTDGSTLKYVYRAGTEVAIDAARWKLVKTIDRGYVLK